MTTFSFARWLRMATGVFVLTVVIGAIGTALQPKVYVATAQVQLLQENIEPLTSASADREVQILQSSDVLMPVVTDLGLHHLSKPAALSDQDAVAHLRHNLKVERVGDTNVINITVTSDLPQEAAEIANAIADRYKTVREVEGRQRSIKTLAIIRNQVAQMEKRVANDQTALDQVKMVFLAHRSLLEAVVNLPDDQFLTVIQRLGLGPWDTSYLQTNITEIESRISVLQKIGATEGDFRVINLRRDLQSQTKQLGDFVSKVRRDIQIDAQLSQQRRQLSPEEVDAVREACDRLGKDNLKPYFDARRVREVHQSWVDEFNARINQLTAHLSLKEGMVRIVSRANAPSSPTSPEESIDLLLSALAGFVAGPLVAAIDSAIQLRRRRTRPR